MVQRSAHSTYLGATPRPHVTVVALVGSVAGYRWLVLWCKWMYDDFVSFGPGGRRRWLREHGLPCRPPGLPIASLAGTDVRGIRANRVGGTSTS
jgi:hypothetical protein